MRGLASSGIAAYLPHVLSLVRIPLGLLVWVRPGDATYLVILMALAGLSDALDGRAARWVRGRWTREHHDPAEIRAQARTGAWLDPLCDKWFVVSTAAAVVVAFDTPLSWVALIALRELLMLPLLLGYRLKPPRWRAQRDLAAGPLGKLTTVAQFLALALILWRQPAALAAAWIAAGLGMMAAVHYAWRALRVSPG